MFYHSYFLTSAVCLGVAALLSLWWYTATGDKKFVKITTGVGVFILLFVTVVLGLVCLKIQHG